MPADVPHVFTKPLLAGLADKVKNAQRLGLETIVHAPRNVARLACRAAGPPAHEKTRVRIRADFADIRAAREKVEQRLSHAAHCRVTDVERAHQVFCNSLSM